MISFIRRATIGFSLDPIAGFGVALDFLQRTEQARHAGGKCLPGRNGPRPGLRNYNIEAYRVERDAARPSRVRRYRLYGGGHGHT